MRQVRPIHHLSFSAKARRLHEIEVPDQSMPFLTIRIRQGMVFRLTYKEGGLAGGYGMVGMLVAYEDDIQENRSPKAPGHHVLDMS